MRVKKSRVREGSTAVTVFIYALVTLICLLALYPFYYVLIQSFASPQEVMAGTAYLWPKAFSFASYSLVLGNRNMWQALLFSVIYVIGGTLLTLATSVMGAYPLTVSKLKFRRFWVIYVLIPMYFGGGLIPTFLQMTRMGLYNNVWAIIIPAGFSVWNIILVRTNIMQIPSALTESAVIDGAGHFTIMTRVVVPLIKPVLAVIAIYSVVGIWNSWFNVLLYLPNSELHPLQFYLYRVMIQQTVDLSTMTNTLDLNSAHEKIMRNFQLKYAMIIISSLPVILTYPFFQRYFIKGIMLGSLKG